TGFAPVTAEVSVATEAVHTDFRLQGPALAPQAGAQLESAADAAVGAAATTAGERAASSLAPAAPSFAGFGSGGVPAGRYLPPGWNTESYGHIVENAFLAAAANPLSTFSID